MCIHIFIDVCVYVYLYIYIYISIYVYLSLSIYIYIYTQYTLYHYYDCYHRQLASLSKNQAWGSNNQVLGIAHHSLELGIVSYQGLGYWVIVGIPVHTHAGTVCMVCSVRMAYAV